MLTTDFSGTYDYEREEAEHAAQCIFEDIQEECLSREELPARIERERVHWKRSLDAESFNEWNKHFISALQRQGLVTPEAH
jgi:hypothetical protein